MHSLTQRFIGFALIVCLAMVGASCIKSNDDGSPPSAGCEVCPTGQVCGGDGICYALLTEGSQLALEVDPPSGHALLRQEYFNLVPRDGLLQLALASTVTVEGTVKNENNPIVAKILARRRSKIPGRQDYLVEATSGADGNYTIKLPLGGDTAGWSILTTPMASITSDTVAPPPHLQFVDVKEDMRLDISLPGASQLIPVSGKVVDSVRGPLRNIPIQMFGVVDDLDVEIPVSSRALTDFQGNFSLTISRRAFRKLRLVCNATNELPAVPEVEMTGVESRLGSALPNAINLGEVVWPTYPNSRRFQFRIHGFSISGRDEPVVGARVLFSANWSEAGDCSPLRAICARHQAEAFSDSQGVVSANLVPDSSGLRTYTVSIFAPAESSLSSLFGHRVEIGAAGGVGADIILGPKIRISGRVVADDGEPLPGAQITITPAASSLAQLPPEEAAHVALLPTTTARSMSGPSDEDSATGQFVVAVASAFGTYPARYDISVVPSPGEVSPRFVWRDVDIGAAQPGTVFEIGDVTAPEGVSIRGRVEGPRMEPIGLARVSVYRASVCQSLPNDLLVCQGPAELVAVADTDGFNDSGDFSAFVPIDLLRPASPVTPLDASYSLDAGVSTDGAAPALDAGLSDAEQGITSDALP